MSTSVLHLQTKTMSETRKGNWKKQIERERKLPTRAVVLRLSLFKDATAYLHGDIGVCEFDVTSSCDVISPDHFVRGFYNSSFRRCRPKFLVLQKEYKILVHNLFYL